MKKRSISLLAGLCMLTSTLVPLNLYTASVSAAPAASLAESTATDADRDSLEGKYVNIALVVDTTGSMYSDIQAVRENLSEFVQKIKDSGAKPRISLIDYKDVQIDEPTTLHKAKDYSVWFDESQIDELKVQIGNLEADGGGDTPESLVDALGFVVNDKVMTWNDYAAKFAIVVTDAGYNETNQWGYKGMADVIDELKAKGIRTTVVTHKGYTTNTWDDKTGGYLRDDRDILLEDEYKDLTEKTDGKIIDLTTDFAAELNEYASEIIAKTAGTEVPDDYVGVTGVELGDDVSIPTDSVYNYPVTVKPVNATNKVIYWSVEDESIATINTELTDEKHCVVNALKPGTTKLIAKSADGGYTAYFTITIADVVSKDDSSVTTKVDKVVDILSDTESKTTKAVLRSSEDKTEIDADTLKDIFVATKDNNKEMEFNFVDEEGDDLYSWTFKGENITDASKTITTFKINPDAASKDLEGKDADAVKKVEEGLAAVKAADDSEIIHFRHEGELPGKAEIKVKVGFDDADDMGLYYFNPETGKFELVNAKVVVKDGYATFEIAHCSDYVLSKVDLTKTAETETKATETVAGAEETKAETTTAAKDASIPKTGDNAAPAAAALAAVMSAAAGAVAFSRKKNAK